MDNLTHTVVGLAVGELLQRSLPAEADATSHRRRHRLLLCACAAASNFPDLDLLLVRRLAQPLGYLLEHRGHTHTLLLAIPQALLLLALLCLWPGARRLLAASCHARSGLALAISAGLLLHLGMDYLNSYGLHPFYPFDMRWFYGDMVFIVEPLFWVAAGVPLLLAIGRRPLRLGWLTLLTVVLAACAVLGYLHWASLLLLATIGLLCWGASRRGVRASLLAGLTLCLAFVGVQAIGSATAQRLLAADLAARDPQARLLDAALTAYPANPLCWNFVAIERPAAGDAYRLRRGVLSLAPAVLAVNACPSGLTGPLRAGPGAAIGLLSEDTASLAALRNRAAADCQLRAWLRFARAPLLDADSASDLRFGTRLAPNFSTIALAGDQRRACPAAVPPWTMPRADLLAP